MIISKKDLKEYILEDQKALGVFGVKSMLCIGKEIGKFELAMRKLEYHYNKYSLNKKNVLRLIAVFYWRYVYHKLSLKCNFDIPINTFGKGLNIHHRGMIVVHAKAKIGDYCDLLPGVVIGQSSLNCVPTIGNHVYIGASSIIIGDIVIANGTIIGANSFVNKSVLEENCVIAGSPAKLVK